MKLNESVNNQSYYRIITNFEGDSVIFEPKGYYEATDDEGNPIMHTGDVWSRSTTPEITASKIIGGAILGLWSMGRGPHTHCSTFNRIQKPTSSKWFFCFNIY